MGGVSLNLISVDFFLVIQRENYEISYWTSNSLYSKDVFKLILTINVHTADSTSAGYFLFYARKTLNGAFQGVFEEMETFLAP